MITYCRGNVCMGLISQGDKKWEKPIVILIIFSEVPLAINY